jgi:hypothetical protein
MVFKLLAISIPLKGDYRKRRKLLRSWSSLYLIILRKPIPLLVYISITGSRLKALPRL